MKKLLTIALLLLSSTAFAQTDIRKITADTITAWGPPGSLTRDVWTYYLHSMVDFIEEQDELVLSAAADPSNINQDPSHLFATQAEKNLWNGKQNALGYTPENTANKITSITTSNTAFPSAGAVKSYVDAAIAALQAQVTSNTNSITANSASIAANTASILTKVTIDSAWSTITDGATTTWTIPSGNLYKAGIWTPAADGRTFNFAQLTNTQQLVLKIKKNFSGAFTPTWDSRVDWSQSSTQAAPVFSTASGGTYFIVFIWDAADNKLYGVH